MVNSDADGRSWAGNAAKESWRCGGLHPAARSHDWYWIQLTARSTTALNRMMALGSDQKGFRGHSTQPTTTGAD